MGIPMLVVHYDSSDLGRVYLGDVGQRHQLGGGKGLYTIGQDRYINHGQDATFVQTGDVSLSAAQGRIKKLSDLGAFSIEFQNITPTTTTTPAPTTTTTAPTTV